MWIIWMLLGAVALIGGVVVWNSLKAARIATDLGLTPTQMRAANALMGALNSNGIRTTWPVRQSLLVWVLGLDEAAARAIGDGLHHEDALREWVRQTKEAAAGEGVAGELEAWRARRDSGVGDRPMGATAAPGGKPASAATSRVDSSTPSPKPVPHQKSIEDYAIDATTAEASKPHLERACQFLGWHPDTTGRAWALGVTAGLAERLRDCILTPPGATGSSLQGKELIAADLCLVCLCDAISQRSGAMFEFTTMTAFGASGDSAGASEAVLEETAAKDAARHNVAVALYNSASNPVVQECFRSIGTAAMRFLANPSEEELHVMRAAYQRLRDSLDRKRVTP